MTSMSSRIGLRATLVLVTGVATAAVIALGAWLTTRYFERTLLDVAEEATVLDIQEIRGVLEETMISEDRRALPRLVHDIAQAPGIVWVGVADAHGVVKLSNDPRRELSRLPEDSVEYGQLLEWRKSGAPAAAVVSRRGPGPMRTIAPLVNGAACQRCHVSSSKVNGLLIIDRSLAPLHAKIQAGRRRVLIGGALGLALIMGIAGIFIERTVLRRLERLRMTTRRFGAGFLDARAELDGTDELGDLAGTFNETAQRLESTLMALAAQRRQLEEIVNGIGDGIVLLDLQGRVLTVNHACAERLGGAPPPPGTRYRDVLRAARLDIPADATLPAERALISGALEKNVVRSRDGARVEELYAQPLRSAHGEVVGAIEVWRDITEREQLEAGLEQSERLASLGVLASSVAHEVGNPLASIITAVDGLLSRLDPGPGAGVGTTADEMRDYLEIVRKQVFRCRTVTERLLGFARVPGGTDAVIDVTSAAREVVSLLAPQARSQGVTCEVVGPTPALACTPPMVVEQVFLNLALNALKAMPAGGRLRIVVALEQGAVIAAFSDTGHGVPAQVRERLFQPFYRAAPDGSGTGLGLFMSRMLVARAGGSIVLEDRPGAGATFTVHLRAGTSPALHAPALRERGLVS